MVQIETYRPEKLSRFVKSFWHMKVPEQMNQPYQEEILPDGHHEIIFNLYTPNRRKKCNAKAWTQDPQTYFTGQNKKSYHHVFDPGTELFGVRFHVHTQHLFYNFPAHLATDTLIPLSDVSTSDILPSCIGESVSKTFLNLERAFTKKASQLETPDNAFLYVEACVQHILRKGGNVKSEALEKITGVSQRHIEKEFKRFIGMSPKAFCNIIRYNNFVNYRKNNPDKTLTACAVDLEFHDQSHLIHLSYAITGKSPKTYFTQPNLINDIFLGD